MKKQILITTILFFIPLIFGMVSGNIEIIEFSGNVKECYISDGLNNLSDYYLDGLNFTEYENFVIINSNLRLSPSNLTISCLVEGFLEKEENTYSGGSSGSSSKSIKNKIERDNLRNNAERDLLLKQFSENQNIEDFEERVIQEDEKNEDSKVIEENEKNNKLFWIIIISLAIVLITYFIYRVIKFRR